MPKKDKKKAAAATNAKAEEPKKVIAAKPKKAKAAKTKKVKAAKAVAAKSTKPKKAEKKKAAKKGAKKGVGPLPPIVVEKARLISSVTVYQGPLFRIQHDQLIEPDGLKSERDVIRHNGSVVILAMDTSKSKKNPWIVIERQYRHAANQYLWELPAGKLDPGEEALVGAKRELAEETGYSAKKWKPLVTYFASPGFLGESMIVFQAEGLVAGDARPEEDEKIEFRLVKLNEVLKMIDKGEIKDGKTLTSVLLYARKTGRKGKK
jgi:ADP-ribose pyrophosphatase